MQGLDTIVDGFVKALTQLMQREAIAALTGSTVSNGRGPVRTSKRAGGKRARVDLDGLRSKVLALIEDNPGKRVEELNRVLGTMARQLALPIKQLVAAEQVRVEGQRRGTRYYPTGKAGTARRPKRRKPD